MDERRLRTALRTLGELAIGASSVELHDAGAWIRDRFPGRPHPGLDDLLRTLERASRG